jgi:hypothetical protein
MTWLNLILASLLLMSGAVRANEDSIYKCGNEFTNNAAEALARGCRKVEGGNVVPSEWKIATKGIGYRLYVNPRTVQMQGTARKAWVMRSFDAEQHSDPVGMPYQSIKSLVLANCKGRLLATDRMIYYSDSVGLGEVVYSTAGGEKLFKDVVPSSIGEYMLETVCDLPLVR